MAAWNLNDIAWDRFNAGAVDPALLALVKASALVEGNADDYRRYLSNVFADDQDFCAAVDSWAEDERRHGAALGAWASLADPTFDPDLALARFRDLYRIPVDAVVSVRGSIAAELLARCAVETGTSSFYAALAEASTEPVLTEICQRIAADELRHYKLFYDRMQKALAREPAGRWRQVSTILGRVREIEDDELACAWHAANVMPADPMRAYNRETCRTAYMGRTYGLYRPHHIRRGVAMVVKAAGFNPQGLLAKLIATVTRMFIVRRARQLREIAFS